MADIDFSKLPDQVDLNGLPDDNEGFLSKIKKKADSFILGHLDELAEKKPGVLNPNPDENPIINKPLLPKAEGASSTIGKLAQGGYNSLVRPMSGVTGILGSFLGEGKPETEPIGLPKLEDIPEPPKVLPKEIKALPAPKEQLALPPATNPEIGVSNNKPSFIAGPAGVAKNVPHQVDLGPINPRLGDRESGTILNRELEGLADIPPDLAARQGMSGPAKHIISESEAAQNALVPDRYKNALQNISEVPNTNKAFLNQGQALPGQPQLPSAVKLGNIETPIENPLRNVGAGVKTITRPEGMGNVGPVPQQQIQAPPIESNLSPKEAIQRWGWGRNSGRFAAQQVKNEFSDITDPDAVGQFQSGDRSGRLKDVANYFDSRFKDLVKAGVLEPEQYKQNYLKQLWEESPEEVNAVFNKSGIGREAGLSQESLFKSYKQGIAAGLTPKYSNIGDIAGAFEKEFIGAMKDQELYNYLKDQGVDLGNKSISDPSTWKKLAQLDPEAQKMVAGYFSKSPELIHKTANVVSATKNLALTQGLPYRTGQVSAHGFNVLQSDIMAQGFRKGLGDFFAGSINPENDTNFVKQNEPMIKKLIENGMNWTDVEDHSALTTDKISSKIDKIPLVGDLNVWRRKAFEDPLFQVHLPAVKLKMALDRYSQLVPKVGDQEALQGAASYANDFAGGVDKTFRNKTYQDLARIGLLAPDWLESRLNIAKGLVTGKPGYLKPGLRGTALAAGPVGAGIASKGIAGYLNSKPSEATGIPAGNDSIDKERDIEPLGTSVEPQRATLQNLTQLSQGNLTYPAKYFGKNKLSPVAGTALRLGSNEDVYGSPLTGKDRFGRPISGSQGALNVIQEMSRPITPSFLESIMDYYRGKASPEEIGARTLGLPITYNFKSKKGSLRP